MTVSLDYDTQLLELLRQLTPDQQQTALDFVRLLNEVMPVRR